MPHGTCPGADHLARLHLALAAIFSAEMSSVQAKVLRLVP